MNQCQASCKSKINRQGHGPLTGHTKLLQLQTNARLWKVEVIDGHDDNWWSHLITSYSASKWISFLYPLQLHHSGSSLSILLANPSWKITTFHLALVFYGRYPSWRNPPNLSRPGTSNSFTGVWLWSKLGVSVSHKRHLDMWTREGGHRATLPSVPLAI